MKVSLNDKQTLVRLVICHSNIKKGNPIEVKPGYSFVFLTEAGFCYISNQSKWDVFKSEESIYDLLTSDAKNKVFAKGLNAKGKSITYNTYKVIYTEKMLMPDHDIEVASIIGDVGGIYNLPLPDNFSEQNINRKWSSLIEKLKRNVGFDPTLVNKENIPFSSESKSKIKDYLNAKNIQEKHFGKVSHRYYSSTKVDSTKDFADKYHKELKLNKKSRKYVRAGRTLKKMMDKNSEFYVPPGIYIIAGCRNIGFEEEPIVSVNGSRRRTSNAPFNNNYQRAKELNRTAKKTLILN